MALLFLELHDDDDLV